MLDLFLDGRHELIAGRAINETMVVTQGEIRHRTNGDGIIDDDRSLLDGADTQDGDLRLIDDRHPELRAELPRVGDREGAVVHFFGLELLGPGRPAMSAMARLRPSRFFSSACLMTGTMRPLSSATATPRLMSFL